MARRKEAILQESLTNQENALNIKNYFIKEIDLSEKAKFYFLPLVLTTKKEFF